MAGRKKLDMIEERIDQITRARQGDALGAWLRTLPDDVFNELARRLDAGECPAALLKEFAK